jgi:integrase
MTTHAAAAGKSPDPKAENESKVRTVQSGSVTVKIYEGRNRGKPCFTVIWYVGQKRERRSFFELSGAKAFAKDRAEKLAAGQIHAPSISPAEAQVFREAMRVAGHLGIPLHMLAAEYAAAASRVKGVGSLGEAAEFYARNCPKVDEHRTVAEVIEEFVERKRHDGLSVRYLEDIRDRLAAFSRSFRTPIFTIRARDIDDWLVSLKVGPRTRNNYRALLSTLFSFAQKRGYLPGDRLHEVLRVDRAKAKGGAIEIFTPGELAEMLGVARGPARMAIALGAFTGIRQAEMLRLDWSDFNWEEGVIDLGIDQTKTASRRLVPILPTLAAWIGGDRPARGRFLPFGEDTAFFRIYRKIVKEVNAKREEGRRDFQWKHNGLRHSYASYRLAIIEDVAKVSLEMGNSPQKIFSNYRKVVTKSQATAWFAVMPVVPENVVQISEVA